MRSTAGADARSPSRRRSGCRRPPRRRGRWRARATAFSRRGGRPRAARRAWPRRPSARPRARARPGDQLVEQRPRDRARVAPGVDVRGQRAADLVGDVERAARAGGRGQVLAGAEPHGNVEAGGKRADQRGLPHAGLPAHQQQLPALALRLRQLRQQGVTFDQPGHPCPFWSIRALLAAQREEVEELAERGDEAGDVGQRRRVEHGARARHLVGGQQARRPAARRARAWRRRTRPAA